jgi:spore germination protein GerM
LVARLVVIALLTLAAAGCGDDTSNNNTAADTTVAPSTAVTTVPPTPTPTAPTTAPEVGRTFDVYLLTGPEDCSAVVARPRTSTAADLVVDALTQLLAGPTAAEAAEGLSSWFSADTAGMLRGVVIANGVAQVSFDGALRATISGASSSCGSAGFMAQLDATVAQFDTVDRAVYSLDGDMPAFYEWLQTSPPTTG